MSKLCFTRGGALQTEFEKLFTSLFDNAHAYIELVNVIATKREVVLRSELSKKAKLSESGGTLTERLDALERAGLIRSFVPLRHAEKGLYYKIIDEYCLFYLNWIKPVSKQLKDKVDLHYWPAKVHTPLWKNWAGYAFEAICRKHISQIKQALYIPLDSLSGFMEVFC
ncbi:MAG: hypothetical protein LBL17_04085 [Coxiellaceae bacterium]|jgi:hypothetical protein|nr:hypothetical protein [Coxiellaceae bacterium]